MRVTLLGHASVMVEMAGVTCLMDPVFFDPFEEGAVESCPSREVYPERIPAPDILIVSHRHPDHFDLASLDGVPRRCDVVCPADPLIVYALRKLGFTQVHPVEPMGEISSADFELFPTRSEAPVREFGMIFKDQSGVFFNQVDSFLAPATIGAALARYGRPDLMFAMYASQNFDFFDSHSASFPYETHRQNLENVTRMRPRTVAPGSAGFRFRGDHQWLNAFLFPISASRFISDLRRLDSAIDARIARPGDVFEIAGSAIHHLPGASEAAAMKQDDTALIEFDPIASIPPLTDPNPDRYPPSKLRESVRNFVAAEMAHFAFGPDGTKDPVVRAYREHRVRYSVEVVFPDSALAQYRFDFGTGRCDFSDSISPSVQGDIVHRIAASALVGWIERRKSFFYVRAYSRRFATLYALKRDKDGLNIRQVDLPDLLMHYLLNVAAGSQTAARRRIDLEIEAIASKCSSR